MKEHSIVYYQVGGTLRLDVSSYVKRDCDDEFYESLKAGEFCYVLNSRQMGKSSLMVRTLVRLQEDGWKGIILDFSEKDSQFDNSAYWYNGIISKLNIQFKLLELGDFRQWLKERDFLSPVERLGEFIEQVLLLGIEQPIVIFVDEIDSTLSLPFTDDFFALIRACYNKRAEKPDYQRLTFALLGVAAPSDLIGDVKRTPFNIGKSIDLMGFTLDEAQPLAIGLAEKADDPQAVLRSILHWTGGQPFLSQRLCQLVADSAVYLDAGSEASVIEGLVHSHLIDQWESQDQQSHLKTISQRVLDNEQKAGYLLELYRQIRQWGTLAAQNRLEERDLQLSGLVVKRDGKLQVYNPIYEAVFDELWIDGELAKLRPYSDSFRAWILSGKSDVSRLLRGDALREAEDWARTKNPSAEDREFLSESRIQEQEEEIIAKEAEANQKAQQTIRRGGVILGAALLVAAVLGGFAIVANRQIEAAHVLNESVEELSGLIDDLYGKDKPEDERQPEAAKDAIEQIGLSFTDFTDNNPNFKKVLLKSSIALAHLRLDPKDNEGKAKNAIDASIDVIEKNPNFFKSAKGSSIAFFSYAVRGNLLEEQNPKAVPADYETAFHYVGADYRTAQNFDLTQDMVEESYNKLLYPEGRSFNRDNFRALATASLKKHYDFREKQAIQSLDPLLSRKAWKDADIATSNAILASIYSKNLKVSFDNLSCSSLKKMDNLWSKHSGGRFGFKAQKEIWVETGNTLDRKIVNILDGRDRRYPDWAATANFYNRIGGFYKHIGWVERKSEIFNFVEYDALFMRDNPENAPKGNLPAKVAKIPFPLSEYRGKKKEKVLNSQWLGSYMFPLVLRTADCDL